MRRHHAEATTLHCTRTDKEIRGIPLGHRGGTPGLLSSPSAKRRNCVHGLCGHRSSAYVGRIRIPDRRPIQQRNSAESRCDATLPPPKAHNLVAPMTEPNCPSGFENFASGRRGVCDYRLLSRLPRFFTPLLAAFAVTIVQLAMAVCLLGPAEPFPQGYFA